MNETELRTDSGMYNAGTLNKQMIFEEYHTINNHYNLTQRIKNGTARDISQEPKVDKLPAIVIGSGPSLDDSIEKLQTWLGGIFCTTSHALTLMRYGIEPTYIVALDPFSDTKEIEGVDWSKTKTKLIAHPGVCNRFIDYWPNEILLYRENMGPQNTFYSGTQKRMYTEIIENPENYRESSFKVLIPTEITLFACSPPIQMFMAQILGYDTIFLCGVDFAYTPQKERFTNWVMTNEGWRPQVHTYTEPTEEQKKEAEERKNAYVTTSNGLPTQAIQLYYKKNFLTAWRLSKQTVYTTDHGAITEIPYRDIEDVVRKQGRHFPVQSKEFIEKVTEEYLAGVGAFVVETRPGAVSFIESQNPAIDLTTYCWILHQQYVCPTCHAELQANDQVDHNDELCPSCKIGKLGHKHDIDIDYNIAKFKRLLRLNGQKVVDEEWKPKLQ